MNKNIILYIILELIMVFMIFWAGTIYFGDLSKHYLAPLAVIFIVCPSILISGLLKISLLRVVNTRTDYKIFNLCSGLIISIPAIKYIWFLNEIGVGAKIVVWVVGLLAIIYSIHGLVRIKKLSPTHV